MAFNFNWSPLTADADFYARARDLLTNALNKSPKPPIIVDDILVSELNLGTVPPDLEILEIGDLAEDRFRGIFKMCYTGDAFLTLKTRVQANPLNTYLDSKPSFTSPKPLAAASGLTIPLSITLSEIKLSAFIILVFSKQKGLTIVFRNDPLESLKVSSTFDSIQFVRDYLQRTIEQQLRNLMMDELPAIIHKLSLQLWCPDQVSKAADAPKPEEADEAGIDPFSSPPEDPVDSNGNPVDLNTLSELSANGVGEMQGLFSQKNLLRLGALTDSQRTLSLFTPGISDVLFRAWSGRGEGSDHLTPAIGTPSLSRTHSAIVGNSTTYTFSDTGSHAHGHLPSRPSLVSLQSASAGMALGAGGRARSGRKKKTRVVNLRRKRTELDNSDAMTETSASDTLSIDVPLSEPLPAHSVPEHHEAETMSDVGFDSKARFVRDEKKTVGHQPSQLTTEVKFEPEEPAEAAPEPVPETEPALRGTPDDAKPRMFKRANLGHERASASSDTSSVILEQAWIKKMAGEIATRIYDEKKRGDGPAFPNQPWTEHEDAPPAYEAAAH